VSTAPRRRTIAAKNVHARQTFSLTACSKPAGTNKSSNWKQGWSNPAVTFVSGWLSDYCNNSCICYATVYFCRLPPFHHLQGCWPFIKSAFCLVGDASRGRDGHEGMQQAECKGQGQGADAAATPEQGTGANQPQTAPAPDLDDLANMMQELDTREYYVIGPDVSPCLKIALTLSTTQHIYTYSCLRLFCYGATSQHFGMHQLLTSCCPSMGGGRASVHHLC